MKKISILLVCLLIIQYLHGQEVLNKNVSISFRETKIVDIIENTSRQYSVDFYYNAAIDKLQKVVNIEMHDVTLTDFFEKLFENTHIVYQVNGNNILLKTEVKKHDKTVIHGYVIDANSKETLIGATVVAKNTIVGTITNAYGFYSLTLPASVDSVLFSFIGYKDTTVAIKKEEDISLNIELSDNTVKMQEVVVVSAKSSSNNSQTGHSKLEIHDIKTLPTFMGENDVIKAMQLTPGVKSGNESSNGFYVRGGGPDQNLVLLDGATLYNTTHSFNLFSVFNTDAIKNVEINKSGYPARYGGRLSSVIDIKMKDGNMQNYEGEVTLGYLTSKFTFEGPIIKGKTSFIISGRRSFIDALMGTFYALDSKNDTIEKTKMTFYDFSAKINHKFSDKNRVFLSFYTSGDGFGFYDELNNAELQGKSVDKIDIKWKNSNSAFRWNHVYSGKLFSNTTFLYSHFNLSIAQKTECDYSLYPELYYLYQNTFSSGIEDYGVRIDFDYFPSAVHSIKFGASAQAHKYLPGFSHYQLFNSSSDIDTIFKNAYNSNDIFGYIEDNIEITPQLKANIGMHLSLLKVGPKKYISVQPRLSARYLLSTKSSIKVSYSKMSQNIHLLTNSGFGLPFDLWVPATDIVPPMNAHQFCLGYVYDFFDNKYEFSSETYFKKMNNLIEYEGGADFTEVWIPWYEKIITGGTGTSYGVEFLFRKKTGAFTGWAGYTLSKTYRSFKEIDNGTPFPYKFDKPHELSVVALYKINDRIDLSASWVFSTGNAFTFSEGTYPLAQDFLPKEYYQSTESIKYFTGRNAVRMPCYHRLDMGINFTKEKKHGIRTWNLSVYNAYARKNPFFIYATSNEDGEREFRQVSLFNFIPSFSYSFKF